MSVPCRIRNVQLKGRWHVTGEGQRKVRAKGPRPHQDQRVTGADTSDKVNRREAVRAEEWIV